jgi:hypothetical protein
MVAVGVGKFGRGSSQAGEGGKHLDLIRLAVIHARDLLGTVVDPVSLPEARLGGGGNAAHVKRSGRPTRVMQTVYYMFHVK